MPKSPSLEQKDFARTSLTEATSKSKVGNFIEVFEDGENVATYLFENNQKGYVGWRWSVTIFQADAKEPATVSEILLIPGPDSLVAPDWVPWSERLADYKALQAELEAQAALEAEEEGDSEDDAEDSDDAVAADSKEDSEQEEVELADSATQLTDESPDAEQNADDTSGRIPRFLRRRLGRLKHKK